MKEIARNIRPDDLPALVRANDPTPIQAIDEARTNKAERAQKVVDALRASGQVGRLDVVRLRDVPVIRLKVGKEYVVSKELSFGQRCMAILLILLIESAAPLIIDQPEDQLDNAFVYDVLVPTLRIASGRRAGRRRRSSRRGRAFRPRDDRALPPSRQRAHGRGPPRCPRSFADVGEKRRAHERIVQRRREHEAAGLAVLGDDERLLSEPGEELGDLGATKRAPRALFAPPPYASLAFPIESSARSRIYTRSSSVSPPASSASSIPSTSAGVLGAHRSPLISGRSRTNR